LQFGNIYVSVHAAENMVKIMLSISICFYNMIISIFSKLAVAQLAL